MGIFLESAEMTELLEQLEMMSIASSLISDLISLAIAIFMCVVMWKINEKAGQPGWACLIPFYSSWIDCKVAKKQWLFWPMLASAVVMVISMFTLIIGVAMAFVAAIESSVDMNSTGLLIGSLVVFGISVIASLVFNVIYSDGLSKAFGQGIGFTIGLIFLPNIFKAIIAFSKNITYRFDDGMTLNGGYNGYNNQPLEEGTRLNESSDWNSSSFN